MTYKTMEEYNADETRADYIARMKEEGFIVVEPKNRELQIDIDTDEQYEIFVKNFAVLSREYAQACILSELPSRNGLPGRHITILMPWGLRDVERIAWQASLGSDPMRELLSMIRQKCGDSMPTLFIEKPEGGA